MKQIAFFVPGEPIGKKRPRQGRGRIFNHPANVHYEGLVREHAAAAMAGVEPFTESVQVILRVWIQPPVSWSEKKRKAAIGTWACCKPDADNVAKAITDAMNGDKDGFGKVYTDDKNIAYLIVTKTWRETPGVHVTVEEIE